MVLFARQQEHAEHFNSIALSERQFPFGNKGIRYRLAVCSRNDHGQSVMLRQQLVGSSNLWAADKRIRYAPVGQEQELEMKSPTGENRVVLPEWAFEHRCKL